MRIWFKVYKDAHLIMNDTIDNYEDDTRTHKVFAALEQVCNNFDFSIPIWLDNNINEFKIRSKTSFNKDNFIEEIEFDYMEMEVLEEDYY